MFKEKLGGGMQDATGPTYTQDIRNHVDGNAPSDFPFLCRIFALSQHPCTHISLAWDSSLSARGAGAIARRGSRRSSPCPYPYDMQCARSHLSTKLRKVEVVAHFVIEFARFPAWDQGLIRLVSCTQCTPQSESTRQAFDVKRP